MTDCPYKMKIQKRAGEYWILGVAGMDPEGVGPFPDKEEALFDLQAIADMWQFGDRPGYVTVEKPVRREPLVLIPRVAEPPPKRRPRTVAAIPASGRPKRKSRKRK